VRDQLRAAFDDLAPDAHPSLAADIQRALASGRRPRRSEYRWVVPISGLALAILLVLVGFRFIRTATTIAIPSQPPQPITRTGPGAQVAWLQTSAGLVAFDPTGKQVANIGTSLASGSASVYGVWRSPDGERIYASGADTLTAYEASSGAVVDTFRRTPGVIVGDAFSPNGRYIALLIGGNQLEVIDLTSGAAKSVSIPSDHSANGDWAIPVFGPDSTHLYAITDWSGPARITAFQVGPSSLMQLLTSVNGQGGKRTISCDGPSLVAKVVGDGATLVTFCHSSGLVSFIDLRSLEEETVIDPRQRNPFWLSPIFTPDGKRLYLHQSPGFGDSMTMIDLSTHKLYGPAPTPQEVGLPGIFASLITPAYAGGVASTVPLSPDGLELYSATPTGIMVLRVPDLKPLAKLASGSDFNEVWVSGDGATLYAISEDGKTVTAMHSDGTQDHSIHLTQPGTFVASEHG